MIKTLGIILSILAVAHCLCNTTDIVGNPSSSTVTGLEFCDMMNGFEADSVFVDLGLPDNNYLNGVDEAIHIAYDKFVTLVNQTAAANGITPCQSCLDNIKYLMCAGAFPVAGYYNCLFGVLLDIFQQSCPGICQCKPGYCCVRGPEDDPYCYDTDIAANPTYDPTPSQSCVKALSTADFVSAYAQCSSYLVSRTACVETLATCACLTDTTAAEAACSYYSPNGFTFAMPGGSCSSSTGWCAATSKRAQTPIAINTFLSVNAPIPGAAQVLTPDPDNLQFTSQDNFKFGLTPQTTTTTTSSNSAASDVAQSLLVWVAGFALFALL